MFPREHGVAAKYQQGNLQVRLERPDFAEDGALFALIDELFGQEKLADRFRRQEPQMTTVTIKDMRFREPHLNESMVRAIGGSPRQCRSVTCRRQ